MSPEERAAFEAVLATDPALQEQLSLYREVDTGLQQEWAPDEKRAQLKGTLQHLRPEYFGQPAAKAPAPVPAKVVQFRRYLGLVTIAAMLLIFLLIWNPFAPNLYKKYAAAEMISQVERGSHLDSVMHKATIAFNNKEYTEAAVLLAEVVQKQPDNNYALFYFGISLMETNQIPRARAAFEMLFKGQSAFKYDAAFYEALSFLKEEDEDTAKDWLEKIPADAPNYKKAQELMEEL